MAESLQGIRLRFAHDTRPDVDRWEAGVSGLAARPLVLETACRRGEVTLFAWSPERSARELAGLVRAAWPEVQVEPSGETHAVRRPLVGWAAVARLPDSLPLQPADPRSFDFPSGLVTLLSAHEDLEAVLQLVVEPIDSRSWRDHSLRRAERVTATSGARWARSLQQATYDKAIASTFRTAVRFAASGPNPASNREVAHQVFQLLMTTFAEGVNGFQVARMRDAETLERDLYSRSRLPATVMTPRELTALWHPPLTAAADVRGIWRTTRSVRSPHEARSGERRIGHDDSGRPVFVNGRDRQTHALVLGGTGTGKTTFVLGQVLADIASRDGGCLIDPKGGAVDRVLERYPHGRESDLVVFDPSATRPVAYNPLARAPHVSPYDVADDVVSALRRLFSESWGPRLERVLRLAVVAVQTTPGATLLDVNSFLVDGAFRSQVLRDVEDEYVREFWLEEFAALSPSVRTQWVEPVLNRLATFLGHPLVRRVLSGSPSLDLDQVLAERRVLLVDFNQSRLGEHNALVLSHLLLGSIHRAAMARVSSVTAPVFYLYVDEAHAVMPLTFVRMLSQARAGNLGVTLITQFLHQLPADVVEALLANAGTTLAFRLGEQDARLLAGRFAPEFSGADLVALDNYTAAARLVSRGSVLRPFTLFTEQTASSVQTVSSGQRLRELSALRYGSEPAARREQQSRRQRPEPPEAVEWEPE